ncbi:MAG: hypothetical protein ACO1OC_01125 [Tuberibacillus sp.]
MSFIAIFLIVILLIFYFVLQRKRLIWSGPRPYMSHRKIILLLGGYGGILILAALFYAFIPIENSMADDSTINKSTELYDQLKHGGIKDINPDLIKKKQEANIPDNQLNIGLENTMMNDDMMINVMVERKEDNDNRVEAYLILNQSYLDQVDITNDLKHNDWVWRGNQFNIATPQSEKKLKYKIASQEFPFNPFAGQSVFSHHSSTIISNSDFYLRVPKDMKINNTAKDAINIIYVK